MVMRLLKFLCELIEQILPFIVFIFKVRTVRKKPVSPGLIARYSILSEESLLDRLKEEHKRGTSIDEKTFKFHGSLAVGLTLINSILFLLAEKITCPGIHFIVNLLILFSVVCLFIGAFIALSAIKTHIIYGYGTEFLVQLKEGNPVEICASALAKQEDENIICHQRNEASFQSVRNGFFCLLIAFIFYLISLTIVPNVFYRVFIWCVGVWQ